MNLWYLASLIMLVLIISHNIKKQKRTKVQAEENFWAKEARANSVRRKPLDGLKYIHVPMEDFPTASLTENSTVAECIEILQTLSTQPIVNLTGYSNTDLKLEYGAANLTKLMEYDQNYTLLARTLQKWADALLEAGHTEEATVLMEYAISTETDVSRTYYCLADYWLSQGETAQVERLIRTAESLRSPSKGIIVKNLQEKLSFCQSYGLPHF